MKNPMPSPMTLKAGLLSKQRYGNILSSSACEPAVMIESAHQYSVVLNLFGIRKEEVYIDVNPQKREFAIYNGKKTRTTNNVSYWVFAVPSDGLLGQMSVRYLAGGLQVKIPRISFLYSRALLRETRASA